MTSARAPSVLIVEDEGIFAEDLRESLVGLGYDAFAIAASSDEALRQVAKRRPDIILMDIRIGGDRDGIETAAQLRDYDVPIIYLTAHTDDATISRAKLTEPHGYLVKPLKAGELRSTIELSLHRHACDRELRARTRRPGKTEVIERLMSLGTLSAGLAHEINNPLAIILSNIEYLGGELAELRDQLQSGSASDLAHAMRLKELTQVQSEITAASSRIANIVADLRDFARPGEPVSLLADVGRAIDRAVQSIAHELRDRASLRHEVDGPQLVHADETRLGQVFIQLLRNAAQAIPPGRPQDHHVTIRSRFAQDLVIVEVCDNGPGIRPEHLDHIFEPFFTTKPVGTGTGLGLSVCHGIVTSLGGTLQVESAPGHGATFRVALRAAPYPAHLA